MEVACSESSRAPAERLRPFMAEEVLPFLDGRDEVHLIRAWGTRA